MIRKVLYFAIILFVIIGLPAFFSYKNKSDNNVRKIENTIFVFFDKNIPSDYRRYILKGINDYGYKDTRIVADEPLKEYKRFISFKKNDDAAIILCSLFVKSNRIKDSFLSVTESEKREELIGFGYKIVDFYPH